MTNSVLDAFREILNQFSSEIHLGGGSEPYGLTYDQALAALLDVVSEKVIGEDAPLDPSWGAQDYIRFETEAENDLRHIQRAALKGKEEK